MVRLRSSILPIEHRMETTMKKIFFALVAVASISSAALAERVEFSSYNPSNDADYMVGRSDATHVAKKHRVVDVQALRAIPSEVAPTDNQGNNSFKAN
jgi:hypothetical protein